MHYFMSLPDWEKYLIAGICIFFEIAAIAVVLTRMGRNPYWSFLILIRYVPLVAVWYLAFTPWPKSKK